MNIGIIGSGKMGGGLGRLWAKQGHHVMFSYSRSFKKLQDLAHEIGSHGRSGTAQDAVRFADLLLLAVPWDGVQDALSAAGSLDGKILISCVNPLGPRGLEVGLNTSAGEEISRHAPGARVVEAFNTIFANILHSRTNFFGENPPTVFYCGDDRVAKTTVAGLIEDACLNPVDAGPLENARYIEPLAMLMIELGHSQQMGSNIAVRLMNPDGEPNHLIRSADELARSFVVGFIGTNCTSAGDEVLAEDFVAHLPYGRRAIRGREAFEARVKEFQSAFSGFQCEIDEIINDGMRVAVRCNWRGTHTGELMGIAPTYRKIQFTETHLLRISGGRIAEDYVSANLLDLMHQLGAAQSAAVA